VMRNIGTRSLADLVPMADLLGVQSRKTECTQKNYPDRSKGEASKRFEGMIRSRHGRLDCKKSQARSTLRI
jgi:hypothetical protein